ncbi:AraC family transcriptional regulator ligand-binding domain-containing protein [Aquirhabdus sp.]|uniref:AraC family transcriptional regulator n=1 Tax=Aquirhabdus sp. TaxID=2824160 RepID=UPI00396CFB65
MSSRVVSESFSYPAYSILLIVTMLEQRGVNTTEILTNCGLRRDSLFFETTKISFRQIYHFINKIIKKIDDPRFTFDTGLFVKRSNCGFFGSGLLSCATYKDADEFGMKYEMVIGSLGKTDMIECDGAITFVYEPILFLDRKDPVYQFIIELNSAMAFSIKRESYGPDFQLLNASFRYDKPAHHAVYEDIYACPVAFGQPCNSISYDIAWRDQTLATANPAAMLTITEICDKQLLGIQIDSQIEVKVQQILVRNPSYFPSFEEVAAELAMHPRTLRRLLKSAGGTYREILSEVQRKFALKYLREEKLTHEELAKRLGFSDGASFRKAYVRWVK